MTTYYRGMTGLPTIDKTPAAKLDYTFNWTSWLAGIGLTGADIIGYAIDAPGLTLISDVRDEGYISVILTGGEIGSSYTVTCSIELPPPVREDNRSIVIRIVPKR